MTFQRRGIVIYHEGRKSALNGINNKAIQATELPFDAATSVSALSYMYTYIYNAVNCYSIRLTATAVHRYNRNNGNEPRSEYIRYQPTK